MAFATRIRCFVVFAAALPLMLALQGCGGGGATTPAPAPAGVATCGSGPSTVKDCQNVDFGSCGNACCNLIFRVDQSSPAEVAKAVEAYVRGAKAVGLGYTLEMLAEGTSGFANLSANAQHIPPPFTGSTSVWIGQVHHTTSGAKHFVDVINFNMRNAPNGRAIVHAFSLSLVGGALGDNGQNYKNIMMLMQGVKNAEVQEHLSNSCPSPGAKATPIVHVTRSVSAQAHKQPAMATVAKHSEAASPQEGSCGHVPQPADCANVDFGSCGNACCSIRIAADLEPTDAIAILNATLGAHGGPDGHYTLQMMNDGAIGFDNLTEFAAKLPKPFTGSTAGVYIGQVHHETSGPKHYNDTINFVVYKDASVQRAGATIRITSVSLIGGALGDDGQGYKNIKMMLDKAFGAAWTDEEHYFNSCQKPAPTPQKNIVELAQATPTLSALVQTLDAAKLTGTLSSAGPFTVFAPNNKAFLKLLYNKVCFPNNNKVCFTLADLLMPENIKQLAAILEYHVVSGKFLSSDLTNGENVTTLEGANLKVTLAGGKVMINDATVETPNVNASNGVVHIIDMVLIPADPPPPFAPKNIVQLAQATPSLSTLVEALEAAKLTGMLSSAGPFTVFAPTNKAFEKLPAGTLASLLKPENIKQLTAILEYHVVLGKVSSSDLTKGKNIHDTKGLNIPTLRKEVLATNGVVHIIDEVLTLPPALEVYTVV